jgi:hypothetical protein
MKKIKEGEVFEMGGKLFTYRLDSGKIILSKSDKKSSSKKTFTPPTLDEVKAFFKEKGYSEESATKAFNHYELAEPKWTDTTGKPVRSWKQKMSTNWFRDEHKVKQEIKGVKFFQ